MSSEEIIRDHYRKEAEACGLGSDSTMRDIFVRDAETRFITMELARTIREFDTTPMVLEIGCGNGFLLSELSKAFPDIHFEGLEFTPELFALAQSRQLSPNVRIQQGDCRDAVYEPETFDVIITERVIINLLDRNDQLDTLQQIHRILKNGSRYIMVESFAEPLNNLNLARQELIIEALSVPHHNLYLDQSVINEIAAMGFNILPTEMGETYLSTHFFISRVVHEAVRPKGGAIRNTEFVKFFDSALASGIGDFSPIRFMVLQKTT